MYVHFSEWHLIKLFTVTVFSLFSYLVLDVADLPTDNIIKHFPKVIKINYE